MIHNDVGKSVPRDSNDERRCRWTELQFLGDDASTGGGNLGLTGHGTTLGTPAYMAPEAHYSGDVDTRADQFSFCVALWEAVYGRRPFGGADVSELVSKVMRGRIDAPGQCGDPAPLRLKCARIVVPSCRDRFGQASVVLQSSELRADACAGSRSGATRDSRRRRT